MFSSMRHHNEHDEHTVPVQPLSPPEPPTMMKVNVYNDGILHASYMDVIESSLAAPTIFRCVTKDGQIMLFDMNGRDFVLKPQVSDG